MICKIGVRCSLVGSDLVCDERTNKIGLKKNEKLLYTVQKRLADDEVSARLEKRKEKTRQDKIRQGQDFTAQLICTHTADCN